MTIARPWAWSLFPICAFAIPLAAASAPTSRARQAAPIAAAVSESHRPAADRQRDALRNPAYLISLTRLKRGQRVADVAPGKGYFTRIFSRVVGSKGQVWAIVPSELAAAEKHALPDIEQVSRDPVYANVKTLVQPLATIAAPASLDVVWTSDNYHDLVGNLPTAIESFDRAVYRMTRAGGLFVVIDYVAAKGSGDLDSTTLHRIDPELVRRQVEAAGFRLIADDTILFNPDDDHRRPIFEMGGRADQFFYVFRKPTAVGVSTKKPPRTASAP